MKDFQELYIRSAEFYSGETTKGITDDELRQVMSELLNFKENHSYKILFAILLHFGKLDIATSYANFLKNQLKDFEEVYAEYLEDQN